MSKFQYNAKVEPKVNYASVINRYPIVREIIFTNNTKEEISNLIIEIEADFIKPYKNIIKLKPEETLILKDLEIIPNIGYFRELTERLPGNISFRVYEFESKENSETLSVNLDIYPKNFWNGYEVSPELISAFVTPNDPYVVKIIDEASQILKKLEPDNPSFDGYQSESKTHVMNQASAIWTALVNKNITYINPPASFGKIGQKIFTCEQILSQRLGTCLDLSVLYASCLERAGINSFIFLISGHAFSGFWLTDDFFTDTICFDSTAISKRINLNEIVAVNAVDISSQKPFYETIEIGKNLLYEDFHCCIDIKSTRARGIIPISTFQKILKSDKEDLNEQAVNIIVDETEYKPLETSKIKDKIDLWSRKLLDLSMRNKLLNFNPGRHGLPIILDDIASLEDNLNMDKEYEILQGIYVENDDINIDIKKFSGESFKNGKLLCPAKSSDMLAKLYRESKNSLEEMGANNLFLAIGLLQYKEYEDSKSPRYAPILLLNMEIRKSIHGYTIKRGELETQMNITMTELLRRNYDIDLGDMANKVKDQSGADVNRIFNIIRKTIIDKQDWDVIETAFLGTFSFNKFVLWQDIQQRKEAIKSHPITGGLIKGFHVWSDLDEANINESSLDYRFNPSDLLCPAPFDSSQLLSVALTDMGKSFILHGAPGTGKSQTITNIIANALGKGRSVLFVAEKRAALEVVQNRLAKIGLDPYCLELHSDKSNKSEVMEQFRKVLDINTTQNINLDITVKNAAAEQNRLNNYVNALHKKRKFGYSVYEIITALMEMKNIPAMLSFSPDFLDEVTIGHFRYWEPKLDQIISCGKLCEPIKDNPWKGCHITNCNIAVQKEITDAFDTAEEGLSEAQKNLNDILSLLHTEHMSLSLFAIEKVKMLLSEINNYPSEWTYIFEQDEIYDKSEKLKEKINIRNKKLSELEKRYNTDVLNLNTEELTNIQKEFEKGGFFSRFRKKETAADILQKYAKEEINTDNIYIEIAFIDEYKKLSDTIEKETKEVFGECKTDFDILSDNISKSKEIKEILYSLCGKNLEKFNENLPYITEVIKNKELVFSENNSFDNLSEKLSAPFDKINRLADLLGWTIDTDDYVNYIKNSIDRFRNNTDKLSEWADYMKVTSDKDNYHLTELIDLYENGEIQSDQIKDVFRKSVYQSLVLNIISKEPILCEFSRPIFEQTIRYFKKFNKDIENGTKEKLKEILFKNKPKMTDPQSALAISVLTREITKKRGGKTIRQILSEINSILPKLKPCMLMSPMSCAQYLDKDAMFDLVIFDEASQIPTSDAIGALSRGRSVVIVGDPKQMPPTSFFNSANIDEDFIETEPDLESILDDCLAINIPSCFLKWHYRSKHEDLIAYSNFRYYNNNMMTFPSAKDTEKFVRFVHLKGYYDQGRTRTNLSEAKAIVKEVKRRLESETHRKKSIGVVTFSVAQQCLIEEKMDEMLAQNPHLDKYYNNPDHKEPVFIKNLENVQGDERDIILFSVCYGPDKNGKVSINFGPINKDGGQRRLNVAISRARYEMIIFSTLDPDQIDLKRTNSLGVRDLKEFMEFAKYGKEKLSKMQKNNNSANFKIESKIADMLREKGYTIDTKIGFSDFKIDMAIFDSETNRYILGITCDGESYKTGKTAKDRNDSRYSVLEMLGWNIHRVWCQDFWTSPEKEIERIETAYREAKQKSDMSVSDILSYSEEEFDFELSEDEIQEEYNQSDETLADTENKYQLSDLLDKNSNDSNDSVSELNTKEYISDTNIQLPVNETENNNISEENININKSVLPVAEEKISDEETITSFEFIPVSLLVRNEDFYNPDSFDIIKEEIKEIIEKEAPVTHEYLVYRIKDLWGFKQLGKNIREEIEDLIKSLKPNKKKENGVITYWGNTDPDTYRIYRYNNRTIENIPAKEMENAIAETVNNVGEIERELLISETAHKLGFSKTGQKIKDIIDSGITKAIKNKRISREGRSTLIIKNPDKQI